MNRNPDKVLSASRRTDIPAFYMDWFMGHINLGFFNIINPWNKTIKKIEVSRDDVHSIVFWSKNYDAFIEAKAGEKLTQLGYNIYFNFSINSEISLLEPHLPSLKKRLEQLNKLASLFGPQKISWRFDPICFYQTGDKGPEKNNLSDFAMIAQKASKLGIKKCVTSFFDNYPKIQRRLKFLFQNDHQTVFFIEPSMDKKRQVIHRMEKHLATAGIRLYLCCEDKVFSTLDTDTMVRQNSCIDGNLLKTLFKGHPEIKRDYGQRSKQGCKCTKSIDIGSYDAHPCFHNCLFCYANPQIDTLIQKVKT
jgi:DNA repair photolyase